MYGPREISASPILPSAWVTLADVKTFLNITGSGSDVLLQSLLDTATMQIEAYCGTYFFRRTITETMFPEDPVRNLVLGAAPVVAMTSLSVDDAAENLLLYTAMLRQGMLRKSDGSTIAGQKLIAVYTVGYTGPADASLPPPLVQAAKEFVRDLYNTRDRVAGVASESVVDVGSVTYGESTYSVAGASGARVSDSVAALLAPFKRDFV